MRGYVIANLKITNPEGFEEYRRQVPATIERYGGRYLVRGGPVDVVEGPWPLERVIVLEFPSPAEARRWYESEDYTALLPLRLENAETTVAFVDGVTT